MNEPLRFGIRHYVPCIRWKQGEYQAISRLSTTTKDKVTPLIEVAGIGWDFENQQEAKTVDEHLEKFAKRVDDKWPRRLAFIDLKLISPDQRMRDGRHPLAFVFDGLRSNGAYCIPVTGLDRDDSYQEAVSEILSEDKKGACLRISIDAAAKAKFPVNLNTLLAKLGLRPENVDLVLDLEAPNFEPLEGFTRMVRAITEKLPHVNNWRTYTICGTSFPETMGILDLGVKIEKRHEWLFYKSLLRSLTEKDRKPTFGDYAISHPKVSQIDMRLVKPAASIRYAINDAWYIVKGKNVRDHGYFQYFDHCAKLVSSGFFMGDAFSAGDDHINKCAQKILKKPGSLTTWRWVGTNHHVQKVVADIATLHGS
jgi:hypothetical protein